MENYEEGSSSSSSAHRQRNSFAKASTSDENPMDGFIDPETFERQRRMAQYQQQQQYQQEIPMQQSPYPQQPAPPPMPHQSPQFQHPHQRNNYIVNHEEVQKFNQQQKQRQRAARQLQQEEQSRLQDSPFNGLAQNRKYDPRQQQQQESNFQQNPTFVHNQQDTSSFQQAGPSSVGEQPIEMSNPLFSPSYQGPHSNSYNPKSVKTNDSTPMTSPRGVKNSPRGGGNFKAPELTIVIDPEYPGEEPEPGVTYPEPELFDIKNTNLTENELEALRTGVPYNHPETTDANSTPNKIVEYLMSFRILKETELMQLNSYRTRRNKLSLNLIKQNPEREFDQKACESLVKKLKDKKSDLQNLIDVVVTKGGKFRDCITIARTLDGRLQVHGKKGFPHVVYGKLWRFADMSKNETRNIESCKHPFESKTDQVKSPAETAEEPKEKQVCVNPFHYEIVAGAMIVGHRDGESQKIPQEMMPVIKTAPIAHIAQAPTMLHSPEPQTPGAPTFSPMVQQQQQHASPTTQPFSPHHQQQQEQQIRMMQQQQQQQQKQNGFAYQQYPSPHAQQNAAFQPSPPGMRQHPNDTEIYPHPMYRPPPNQTQQQLAQQYSQNYRMADPRQQIHEQVPLNKFRDLCKETFGPQFFGAASKVEVPQPPYPAGTYTFSPVLGVTQFRRRITRTDHFDQTNMPKNGAYSDMTDSIAVMSRDKLTVTKAEPPAKQEPENWATIVYYEYSTKISEREVKVNELAVDGGFTACDNRFCLGLEPNPNRTQQAFKIRRLIIDGIRLSLKENGDVWLQSYISWPCYVTSGYLDDQSGAAITEKVHKLYGGCKLKVFGLDTCKELIRDQLYSSQMASMYLRGFNTPMNSIYGSKQEEDVKKEAAKNTDSLQRYCTVRISFAKGFGNTYACQEIKHTPCWIEVKVNSAFNWMDKVVCDLAHRCKPLKLEDFARLGIDVTDD